MTIVERINRTKNVVGRINSKRAEAAAVSWWLSGGIAAANCLVAYQAKGAADYATSKVNLANPGTYNAYEGIAPSWNTATGWSFNNTPYLLVNITVAKTWTFIVRHANLTNAGCTFGNFSGVSGTAFLPNGAQGVSYYNGGVVRVLPVLPTGVLAIANLKGYRNGVEDGNISATPDLPGYNYMAIGAVANNSGGIQPYNWLSGDVLALSVYNITLPIAQIAAVTTAMAAL